MIIHNGNKILNIGLFHHQVFFAFLDKHLSIFYEIIPIEIVLPLSGSLENTDTLDKFLPNHFSQHTNLKMLLKIMNNEPLLGLKKIIEHV